MGIAKPCRGSMFVDTSGKKHLVLVDLWCKGYEKGKYTNAVVADYGFLYVEKKSLIEIDCDKFHKWLNDGTFVEWHPETIYS